MITKNQSGRHALLLLEIAMVALLGLTVLTSDRIGSSNAQDANSLSKAQRKALKKQRSTDRWIPAEGIPESASQNLLAVNGTLSCQLFDFESGDQGFTVLPAFDPTLVLWHVTNNLCRANLVGHSTPHTFYYGQDLTCNYDTGARNASNLISPAVSLAGIFPPFMVSFNYLLFVEGGGFDTPFVDLSTDNGTTWTQILSKANLINDNQWHNVTRDVTAFVGMAGSVRLRFRFDTIDNTANTTTGWHVDDVQVCGSAFNACIQDDSNGSLLLYNSVTGQYQFNNCHGTIVGGTGTLTVMGSITTLQDNRPDRRVLVRIDGAAKRATASIQLFSPSRLFTITDRNTTNNTCTCPP
jgi:hypothetical protein